MSMVRRKPRWHVSGGHTVYALVYFMKENHGSPLESDVFSFVFVY